MGSKFAQLDLFALEESAVSIFKIFPDEANNGDLRTWIELAGGIVLDCYEDDPYAIRIIDLDWFVNVKKVGLPSTLPSDVFLPSFIYDCYEHGRVFDLNLYKLGNSIYQPYDANEILRRTVSWSSLKKRIICPQSPVLKKSKQPLKEPVIPIPKSQEIQVDPLPCTCVTPAVEVESEISENDELNFTVKNGTFSFKDVHLSKDLENVDLNNSEVVPTNVGISSHSRGFSVDIQDDEELILRNNPGTETDSDTHESARSDINETTTQSIGSNTAKSPDNFVKKPRKLSFKMCKPKKPYSLHDVCNKEKKSSGKKSALSLPIQDQRSIKTIVNGNSHSKSDVFANWKGPSHQSVSTNDPNETIASNGMEEYLQRNSVSERATNRKLSKSNGVECLKEEKGVHEVVKSTRKARKKKQREKKDKQRKTNLTETCISLTAAGSQDHSSSVPTDVGGNCNGSEAGDASHPSELVPESPDRQESLHHGGDLHCEPETEPNPTDPGQDQLSKLKKKKRKRNKRKYLLQEESAKSAEEMSEPTNSDYNSSAASVSVALPKQKTATFLANSLQKQTFSCGVCDYSTVSNKKYASHMLEHTGPVRKKKLRCAQCSYSTRKQSAFDRHRIMHSSIESSARDVDLNGEDANNDDAMSLKTNNKTKTTTGPSPSLSHNGRSSLDHGYEPSKVPNKMKKNGFKKSSLSKSLIDRKNDSVERSPIFKNQTVIQDEVENEKKSKKSSRSPIFPPKQFYQCNVARCPFSSETAYELRIHSRSHSSDVI